MIVLGELITLMVAEELEEAGEADSVEVEESKMGTVREDLETERSNGAISTPSIVKSVPIHWS